MSGKWKLDPGEVGRSFSSSSSGKGGQFNRRLKVTSCKIVLTHLPTGLQVQGEIPPGGYSKQKMRKLREEMCQNLFSALEEKVAKHLRVSGR